MMATRIDTKQREAARILRNRFRAEGRAAFAGQETAPTPPYAPDSQAAREWLHGWWSVHYGYYCGACGGKHNTQKCPDVRALLMRDPEPTDEEGPCDDIDMPPDRA